MSDENETNLEPVDVVTTDTEITPEDVDKSQSALGGEPLDNDLVLDAEGLQDNKPNFNHELPEYKAFKKEKEAKRRKQQLINEMAEKDREREIELANLRETVQNLARGEKPTLESCDYDAEVFEKKLDAWKNYTLTKSEQDSLKANNSTYQNTHQPPTVILDDHTEYAHFNNEQNLKKSFKDYDNVVEGFKNSIHEVVQHNLNTELPKESVVNAVLNVGYTANVDMSKAMYAIEKIPSLKNELLQQKTLNSDILVADILRKAEKAIKSGKSVSSKPPEQIRQSGAVDHTNAAVKKAFDDWCKTGSAKAHATYRNAKKALNNGGSG